MESSSLMRPFISWNSVSWSASRAGKRGFGIGIFRQQVAANILRERRGIAHHLLPVPCAQPRIVVDPLDAVMNAVVGPPLGDWSGGLLLRYIFVHDAPAVKKCGACRGWRRSHLAT